MHHQIYLEAVVSQTLNDTRLDVALAQLFPAYSRSQIQEWIQSGFVTIDNQIILKNKIPVKTNQAVLIQAKLTENIHSVAQLIPLDIIFEDEDIIVINKPVGLIVHPGAGNPDKTLFNALLHHTPTSSFIPRAGIIHRIDKNTSGLLVIAKNLKSHHALIQQMQKHRIQRHYQALVYGNVISGGTIDAPIGRHPIHRIKMTIINSGKTAITHYRILEKFRFHTLLDVQLETGRTHQIRVHLSHKQYPIVGDPVYKTRTHHLPQLSQNTQLAIKNFNHQALHAAQLSFIHPVTKQLVTFKTPLPDDFQNLLSILRDDMKKYV